MVVEQQMRGDEFSGRLVGRFLREDCRRGSMLYKLSDLNEFHSARGCSKIWPGNSTSLRKRYTNGDARAG